jgi:serine/threonine protein phosphatase PrpC
VNTRWLRLTAVGKGRRINNADRVAVSKLMRAGATGCVLVVADGIGDSEAAEQTAQLVCDHIREDLGKLWRRPLLRRQHPAHVVASRLAQALGDALAGFQSPGESTFAAAVVEPSRVCSIWAGDTRVYLLDSELRLRQLTQDHVNSAGHITACVRTTGICGDGPSAACEIHEDHVGVFGCTDGVHKSCTDDELRRFLAWCARARIRDSAEFSTRLASFLMNSRGDNFAAGLIVRRDTWTTLGKG